MSDAPGPWHVVEAGGFWVEDANGDSILPGPLDHEGLANLLVALKAVMDEAQSVDAEAWEQALNAIDEAGRE